MTTLYRTPNIIIDAHEWHAIVRLKDRRASVTFLYRPLRGNSLWHRATSWQGRKPKGLGERFKMFRRHIELAMGSEARRRTAACS